MAYLQSNNFFEGSFLRLMCGIIQVNTKQTSLFAKFRFGHLFPSVLLSFFCNYAFREIITNTSFEPLAWIQLPLVRTQRPICTPPLTTPPLAAQSESLNLAQAPRPP